GHEIGSDSATLVAQQFWARASFGVDRLDLSAMLDSGSGFGKWAPEGGSSCDEESFACGYDCLCWRECFACFAGCRGLGLRSEEAGRQEEEPHAAGSQAQRQRETEGPSTKKRQEARIEFRLPLSGKALKGLTFVREDLEHAVKLGNREDISHRL